MRYHRGAWHRWLDKHYCAVSEEDIRLELTEFIRGKLNELDAEKGEFRIPVDLRLVSNVRNALASKVRVNSQSEPPFYLTDNPATDVVTRQNHIAMSDGILCLETLRIFDHTPDWFSTVILPYCSDANHPEQWFNFLCSSLEEDDERIRLLQEFMGYLLVSDTSHQKFLLMVGEGENGKSVVCAVLEALLGVENISNVPLECFGQRFALTQTLNKLANIVSEIGDIDKAAEGLLKAFTSGDRMFFDRKGIAGVEARPTARLVLATNNLPRFTDRSRGLWRRMVLMPFNKKIEKSQRVLGMDKPEFWEDEIGSIFSWCLEGLCRLRERGHFTESELCSAALDEYQRDTNPARTFLEETCISEEGASVSCEKLYKEGYRKYCEDHGTHPLGERLFGKEVKRVFPNVTKTRLGCDGARSWCYEGISYSADGWEESVVEDSLE